MQLEAFGKTFDLDNDEKYGRAVNGTIGRGGLMQGGVGEDATNEQKIAEYDRLGGAIFLPISGTRCKVKRGTFFDFKSQKIITDPTVVILFPFNGVHIEFNADEPITPDKLMSAIPGAQKLPPVLNPGLTPGEELETEAAGRRRTLKGRKE